MRQAAGSSHGKFKNNTEISENFEKTKGEKAYLIKRALSRVNMEEYITRV